MSGGSDYLASGYGLATDGADLVAGVAVLSAGGVNGILDFSFVTGGCDGLGVGFSTAGAGVGHDAIIGAGGGGGHCSDICMNCVSRASERQI